MTRTSRHAALAATFLIATSAAGCSADATDDPFDVVQDSPLHIPKQEFAYAADSTARLEVGPWDDAPNLFDARYGLGFDVVSATSSDPSVVADAFELPAETRQQQFVTLRAGEPGMARVRVEGAAGRGHRAAQVTSVSVVEPHDVSIRFGRCPRDAERPVIVNDGEVVRIAVVPQNAAGDDLGGYLGEDIAIVGPGGDAQQVEPEWIDPFPMANSTFIPADAGEYTVEVARLGRSEDFEIVRPADVDRFDIQLDPQGSPQIVATPSVTGKTICRSGGASYAVNAEILTPDRCEFDDDSPEQTTSATGVFRLARTPGGTGICEVRLSYPRGNDGQGVEQIVEVAL